MSENIATIPKSASKSGRRSFWELPHFTKLDPRKREWVYFVQAVPDPFFIKIGKAQALRWRLLTLQTMSPVDLKLVGAITGPPGTERVVHAMFDAYRRHGEWFLPAPELLAFIQALPKGGPVRRTRVEQWAAEIGVDLNDLVLKALKRRQPWAPDSLGRRRYDYSAARGEMPSADWLKMRERFPGL